jgi:hypothetical protein
MCVRLYTMNAIYKCAEVTLVPSGRAIGNPGRAIPIDHIVEHTLSWVLMFEVVSGVEWL